MEAIAEAKDLARTLANALLWSPKVAPWDHALYLFQPEYVSFVTSDMYAVTVVDCPAVVSIGEGIRSGKASRDLVEAMQKRASASKGEVRLAFEPRVGLTYRDHLKDEDLFIPDTYVDGDWERHEESPDDMRMRVFWDLLEDRADETNTHRFMINPKYARKLAQTKAENNDIGTDFWVFGDAPVFVRVGRYSRTVIQPIDRTRHEDKNGKGVLW